ncbi:uncharacterized protein C4orf54 [Boleophthalmus pectinirostris]|uniref:uncharacterized protein C4orf54 n=1 Tax=Boleophthalmus pectinirostris TaxID=150288 RepID=UPI00242EAEE6|nr:uncharacterized protein C4orf54 [Boleophthalmus pectinirostris]
MEAAEETLTYRDDTGLHKKLLPEDKAYKDSGKEIKDKVEARSDESNYMDTKTDSAKTVKVSFTGEGNQLSVSKCDGSKQGVNEKLILEESADTVSNQPVVNSDFKDADFNKLGEADGHETSECSELAQSESDDLHYTDMYLNSKTEDEDDEAGALLSHHYGFDTGEDESHYITTHEIQLTELDHDVDYDLGRGTRWEFEDDNLVYSFVDYATLETDNTNEGTLILEGKSASEIQANLGGRVVSTEQDESDLFESDKFASSDESFCKNQSDAGKIHLSIQTASRAVNEPPLLDSGDRGRLSLVSAGARAGPLSDRAQYFIPAPGRQHLATKLRRKDINEYSSGASSSISELDDADKEVRNLTAKSFRSLACPYFDAINLSTSSESSISEYGLNKWAFVDWNYRNVSRSKEHSIIAHKNTNLEMNQSAENKVAQMKHPHGAIPNIDNEDPSVNLSNSNKQNEPGGPVQDKQREVTLNFRCNVEAGVREGTKRPKSSSARSREVHGTVLARSRCEMEYRHTDDKDPHKKAIFASSLLKNVISKKMQFEKERKMERGEIHDSCLGLSPCGVLKVRDLGRSMQRQTSESGSGVTVNSAEELHVDGSRASSSEPVEEGKSKKDQESQKEQLDSPSHHMPDPVKETEKNPNSMLTKLLFVPRCQLYTKDKDFSKDVPSQATNSTGKPPEIKICLRSVKENKGCTLNIASLLTPKISYSAVNTLRAAGEIKCPIVSASDKMPTFTVRDIRDTKCKFQTPIYQVRDVRKLVKSSYRFVSLDNSENKNPTAISTAADTADMAKKAVKQPLTAPMVIKCHSVKTNVKKNTAEVSQKEAEAGMPFSKVKFHPVSSEMNSDHVEAPCTSDNKQVKQRVEKTSGEFSDRKTETKIPKQAALEKLKAAVKSMEQLYVFDRNEWKRKNQALHSMTGSHVQSLISKEEQREEEGTVDRARQAQTYKPHAKGYMNVMHVPFNCETLTQLEPNKEGSRSTLHPEHTNKSHMIKSSINNPIPQCSAPKSYTVKSSKTAAPVSVKIDAPKCGQLDKAKVTVNPSVALPVSDSENYLTIPGLTPEGGPGTKEDSVNKHETYITTCSNKKNSPLIMEYPSSALYHHSNVVPQHVLCFSPSVPTVSPTPSGGDTQKKMLLDPATGHYYLVDTPVQPTKRLYDPDTGQFVDLPLSHSPVSPVTPVASVTPVPLSVSPLACAPTYMIYPGFIPSPTLTMQPVPPQSHCEEASHQKKHKDTNSPVLAEKVYYSPSGEASQSDQLPGPVGHVTSGGRVANRPSVISISTPHGPRIIAPPSFDGTTMSFIVEHR